VSQRSYSAVHRTEIEPAEYVASGNGSEWRPGRHDLRVSGLGINTFTGRAPGDLVVERHEAHSDYEELYFVADGAVMFSLGDEVVEADKGTFVFVSDPSLTRTAIATAADTLVVAVASRPGVPRRRSPAG
jgi:hypothetical protein